ncbi:MAG: hypothetical protein ACOC3E_02590 [Cyanobacteriota bacterium]
MKAVEYPGDVISSRQQADLNLLKTLGLMILILTGGLIAFLLVLIGICQLKGFPVCW